LADLLLQFLDIAFFGFFTIQIIIRKSCFSKTPVLFWRHFVASAIQITALRTDTNVLSSLGKGGASILASSDLKNK
jgi:hypothetical protein